MAVGWRVRNEAKKEAKSPGSGTPENFTDTVYRGKIRVEEKDLGGNASS